MVDLLERQHPPGDPHETDHVPRDAPGERGQDVLGPLLERLFPGEVEQRSEEHTSELQSRGHLVCRLLLEKKKIKNITDTDRRRTDNAMNLLMTCERCSVSITKSNNM